MVDCKDMYAWGHFSSSHGFSYASCVKQFNLSEIVADLKCKHRLSACLPLVNEHLFGKKWCAQFHDIIKDTVLSFEGVVTNIDGEQDPRHLGGQQKKKKSDVNFWL